MDPILGQLIQVPWSWTMRGWMPCKGQILQINQNQALFALLGTNYGGDGHTTFGLPDCRPIETSGGDLGHNHRREWKNNEIVTHICVQGYFPMRD
jgi:microcystin-dependent protein